MPWGQVNFRITHNIAPSDPRIKARRHKPEKFAIMAAEPSPALSLHGRHHSIDCGDSAPPAGIELDLVYLWSAPLVQFQAQQAKKVALLEMKQEVRSSTVSPRRCI